MSNIPTVRSICEAFGRGDIPALLGYLSQNIVWTTEWPSLVCRGRNRDVAGDVAFVIKATDRTVVEEDEVLICDFDTQGQVARFRHKLHTHQHWAACRGG